MAIEIIPKPKIKGKPKIEIAPLDLLYYLVIFLLCLTFLSYLGMLFLSQSLQKELADLKTAIAQKESKEAKLLEQRILNTKEKIDTFFTLFSSYKKSTALFNFLKENCHKKVFFSKVDLNVPENKLLLSGRAESFRALQEQMLIFQKEALVKDALLTDISIGEEGGVDFNLTLIFDPKVFK